MPTSYPGAIDSFGFTAAAGKALPYDVLQRAMDAIVAIETALGTGAAAGTSFTPTLVSSGGGTPTYTLQTGRYRTFAGLVHIKGAVSTSGLGTLAAGTITIGGLPIAHVNLSADAAVCIPWWGTGTPVVNIVGLIQPGASQIAILIATGPVTVPVALQQTDLAAVSALEFSALYPYI